MQNVLDDSGMAFHFGGQVLGGDEQFMLALVTSFKTAHSSSKALAFACGSCVTFLVPVVV